MKAEEISTVKGKCAVASRGAYHFLIRYDKELHNIGPKPFQSGRLGLVSATPSHCIIYLTTSNGFGVDRASRMATKGYLRWAISAHNIMLPKMMSIPVGYHTQWFLLFSCIIS